MGRCTFFAVLLGTVFIFGNVVVFAGEPAPVLVPQADFYTTDRAWIQDTQDIVGISSGIVVWDSKSGIVKSYGPLIGANTPVLGPARPDSWENDPHGPALQCLSRDGKYAVLKLYDPECVVIDTRTGARVMKLKPSKYVFSDSPNILVEAADDEVRLWSVPDGKLLSTMEVGEKSKDYTPVLSSDGGVLVAIGAHASIYDAKTGRMLRTLKHDADILTPATLSPDGNYLATAGEDPRWQPPDYPATESAYRRNSEMLIWEVSTGKLLARRVVATSGGRDVHGLFFLEGGRKLVCSGKSVTAWTVPECDKSSLPGDLAKDGIGRYSAVSPNETMLWADEQIYSLDTGKKGAELATGGMLSYSVAFSPDGKLLAVANESDTLIWDLTTFSLERRLGIDYMDHRFTSLFFPRSDCLFASSGGSIAKYEMASRKQWAVRPPGTVQTDVGWRVITPDGKIMVAQIEKDGWPLGVWNMASGKQIKRLSIHLPDVDKFTLSPNGRFLAANSTHQQPPPRTLVDLKRGTSSKLSELLPPYVFSPDSSLMLATRPRTDGPVKSVFHDTRTAKTRDIEMEVESPGGPPVFSPDGKLIAIPSRSTVRLFNAADGRYVTDLQADGRVRFVAFHPSGKILAASCGPQVVFWNIEARQRTLCVLANGMPDWWLAYTPDGYYTGSQGIEQHIRWRIGEQFLPGSEYAGTYRRPDKVRAALGM